MKRNKRKSKKQKIYYMIGCSKTRKNKKKYLGGDPFLSYPNNVKSVPNPHLAYSGGSNIPVNVNGKNPYYPNTGPEFISGADTIRLRTQTGGAGHRDGCKCSKCKNMKGGNDEIKYPNGLVGTAWTANPSSTDIIPGNGNHYKLNNYDNDISRQMVDLGGNKPYLDMKGGNKKRISKKQKGGNLSNFLAQDLINFGRQIQYGLGSAYNSFAGYQQPVNPLPWKDQLTMKTNVNIQKI